MPNTRLRSLTVVPVILALAALTFFGAPVLARSAGADADRQLECLALAIYFEARGESEHAQSAVAHVVVNRSTHEAFPATYCDVVRDGGERPLYRCQFSWWCDGRPDDPTDRDAWQRALDLAAAAVADDADDPTGGALWFHHRDVKPSWRTAFRRTAMIGSHVFYAGPEDDGRQVASAE